MAFESKKEVEIIEVMNGYWVDARPPEEIKNEIDISYKVENQSIIVFEIRPKRNDSNEKLEINVAKATYVKKEDYWKIFWFRADRKWHSYDPNPKVKNLKDFVKEVKEDRHGCFWG